MLELLFLESLQSNGLSTYTDQQERAATAVSFLHDLQAVTHMLRSLDALSSISEEANSIPSADEHLLRGLGKPKSRGRRRERIRVKEVGGKGLEQRKEQEKARYLQQQSIF